MDCMSDTELHSLDVALDRSLNLLAFAVGDDGTYIAEVRAFPYHGHDHYVAYVLTPTGEPDSYRRSHDRICSRSELIDWLVECGIRKSKAGAQAFLSKLVWKADIVLSSMVEREKRQH